MTHFGVTVREGRHGLKLNRSNYVAGSRICSFPWQYGGEYDGEELARYIQDCVKNFNLNMEYFARLGRRDFNQTLDHFLVRNIDFKAVPDLKVYDGAPGYYMMVLDEYKQVYLGTTKDIKARVQKHWKNVQPLDRLISGTVGTSIISIDSFRALDTTRLYAFATPEIYGEENRYIEQIAAKYLCNRTIGGKLVDGKGKATGLGEAIGLRKTRNLR